MKHSVYLIFITVFTVVLAARAKNPVKIVTIGGGGVAVSVNNQMSYQQMVDQMIDYWQRQLSKVLLHKPDLILLTEACDRPSGLTTAEQFEYYKVRKDQVKDYHRQHSQQGACHQHGEVGGELAAEGGQAGGEGHHVQVGVDHQGPHQVAVCEHGGEDGQGGYGGAGEGEHDFIKGLPLVAAVQIRGLADLLGNPHIGLPQEEYAEGADDAGKHQGEDAVGQTHLGHHLILGDNENLGGQRHLHQHNAEQQLLAPELQHGEGVARHGAEGHSADDAEENHQAGVEIQLEEGQALHCVCEVAGNHFLGEDGGRHLHALRDGFQTGENHPHEGENHDERADNQSCVGDDGHPFLGGL